MKGREDIAATENAFTDLESSEEEAGFQHKSEDVATSTPDMDNVAKYAVMRAMDISDSDEVKHADRIQRVLRWAASRGAVDRPSITAEIMRARNINGSMDIYDLATFAGLELQRMEIDNQIAKFRKPEYGDSQTQQS